MPHVPTLVGISGSLRRDSYSTAVLSTLAARYAGRLRIEPLDIGRFPLYNQDLEHERAPDDVRAARAEIDRADGVLVIAPEFNHGVPGVLKNALDWLSRPAFSSCFADKPVLFMTIAPGALGGVRAQSQLRETFSSMRARLLSLPEIAIPQIADKISDGELVDQPTLEFIDQVIAPYLAAL